MPWVIAIAVRLIVPFSILRYPLAGAILSVIADNLDVVILDALGVTDFTLYNAADKALDMYMQILMGYMILSWKSTLAKRIGIGLLVYRLIGFGIYEVTQERWLLFIFPNVFIFYYIYYLGYKALFKTDPTKRRVLFISALIAMTSLKLAQEYMLHIAQFPIYRFLKATFFPFIS